jgi:hypothetical protein
VPDLSARLAAAWADALTHLRLALVPAAVALVAVGRIREVVASSGFHAGLTARLPTPVVDVWGFVSLPGGSGQAVVGPGSLALLPVAVVLRAALGAGLVGSCHAVAATGEYDFLANVRRHLVPFLGYAAVTTLLSTGVALLVAGGVLVGGGGASTALGPLAIPVLLLLGYLFWATPFLVVTRETGLVPAARASLALATDGGRHAAFSAGHLLVVAVASVPVTLVVANGGLVGVLLGAVGVAPVGLTLTLATVVFVADHDPASTSLWDGQEHRSGPG